MGVDLQNCRKVAELVGIKTILNEFVAYARLGELLHNKKLYTEHLASNGSWHYAGDDIILYHNSTSSSTLTGGILTVSIFVYTLPFSANCTCTHGDLNTHNTKCRIIHA